MTVDHWVAVVGLGALIVSGAWIICTNDRRGIDANERKLADAGAQRYDHAASLGWLARQRVGAIDLHIIWKPTARSADDVALSRPLHDPVWIITCTVLPPSGGTTTIELGRAHDLGQAVAHARERLSQAAAADHLTRDTP